MTPLPAPRLRTALALASVALALWFVGFILRGWMLRQMKASGVADNRKTFVQTGAVFRR